jgi:hypothetical protein
MTILGGKVGQTGARLPTLFVVIMSRPNNRYNQQVYMTNIDDDLLLRRYPSSSQQQNTPFLQEDEDDRRLNHLHSQVAALKAVRHLYGFPHSSDPVCVDYDRDWQ